MENRIVCALNDAGVPPTGAVGLAVSGGLDSMTLLKAAVQARTSETLQVNLTALHLDHGLRTDSAADCRWVSKQADSLGVPFTGGRIDLAGIHREKGGSLEGLAREIRYQWLAEQARELGLDAVMTAHHGDDQVESVALHVLRGSGWRGLSGMASARPILEGDNILLVRPFLPLSREDIQTWAASHGVQWREDATNLDTHHRRNRLRHEILPDLGNDISQRLADLGRRSASVRKHLEEAALVHETSGCVQTLTNQRRRVDLAGLRHEPEAVVRELVDRQVRILGAPSLPDKPWQLAYAGQDGTHEVTRQVHLVREGDCLEIVAASEPHNWEALPLPVPGKTRVPHTSEEFEAEFSGEEPTFNAHEQWLPDSALEGPLQIRAPHPGERMHPFGLQGTKLLSDLLQEAGIPQEDRWSLPMVADDGGVLWIPGIRADERCRLPAKGRMIRLVRTPPGPA